MVRLGKIQTKQNYNNSSVIFGQVMNIWQQKTKAFESRCNIYHLTKHLFLTFLIFYNENGGKSHIFMLIDHETLYFTETILGSGATAIMAMMLLAPLQ